MMRARAPLKESGNRKPGAIILVLELGIDATFDVPPACVQPVHTVCVQTTLRSTSGDISCSEARIDKVHISFGSDSHCDRLCIHVICVR